MGDCFFTAGPISIGDCGQKSTIKLNTNILQASINEIFVSSINQAQATTVAQQNQDITILGFSNCNVTIDQTLKFDATMEALQTTEVKSQTFTNFVNDIDKNIKQISEQKTGVLGSVANQSLAIELLTQIKSIITNQDNINSINKTLNESISSQNQKVTIVFAPNSQDLKELQDPNKQGCNIVINQTTISKVATKIIMKSISEIIRNNSVVNQLKYKLDQASKQENVGFDAIIQSIMDFLKSGVGAIALVLIVGIIGLVFVWKFLLENPENLKTLTDASLKAKGPI
jgi:hypothetical protein